MGTICQLFDKKNIRTSHYDGPILSFFSLSKRRQNEAPLGVGGGRWGGGVRVFHCTSRYFLALTSRIPLIPIAKSTISPCPV